MYVENGLVDTVWEREGGSSIDIYTPPCVKWMASGKLLYSAGSSARCSVMAKMGRMGGVGGRLRGRGYVYTWS